MIVDGYNVLHAVVLKGRERRDWWRNEMRLRVVELAHRYRGEGEVWCVFDTKGESAEPLNDAPLPCFVAPHADDFIVELVEAHAKEREVFVVSSDRALIDRAKHRGGSKMSPWQFAEQCIESGSPDHSPHSQRDESD